MVCAQPNAWNPESRYQVVAHGPAHLDTVQQFLVTTAGGHSSALQLQLLQLPIS